MHSKSGWLWYSYGQFVEDFVRKTSQLFRLLKSPDDSGAHFCHPSNFVVLISIYCRVSCGIIRWWNRKKFKLIEIIFSWDRYGIDCKINHLNWSGAKKQNVWCSELGNKPRWPHIFSLSRRNCCSIEHISVSAKPWGDLRNKNYYQNKRSCQCWWNVYLPWI